MSQMVPHFGHCFEDVPKVINSYIEGLVRGTPLLQDDVDEINYLVNQYDTKAKAEADTDPTEIQEEATAGAVTDLIFDTLQAWEVDLNGFNFQMTLPGTSFPTKAKWYVIEVWITPVTGDDFLAGIWILECLPTRRD